MQALRHEIENYSWEVIQNMIEKEISAAFKIKEPPPSMPSKKEIKRIIKDTVMEQRKTLTTPKHHSVLNSMINVIG